MVFLVLVQSQRVSLFRKPDEVHNEADADADEVPDRNTEEEKAATAVGGDAAGLEDDEFGDPGKDEGEDNPVDGVGRDGRKPDRVEGKARREVAEKEDEGGRGHSGEADEGPFTFQGIGITDVGGDGVEGAVDVGPVDAAIVEGPGVVARCDLVVGAPTDDEEDGQPDGEDESFAF